MIPDNYLSFCPKTIQQHRDGWLWGKIWYAVHHEKKMFTGIFCGNRGAGKSYSQGDLSYLLDRGKDDIPRFSIERTCYSPSQFAEWVAKEDLPKGTVVSLDDAGLSLYSKESLTKVAIQLGKVFQTMRYKELIVLMSLPYFSMLESHARKFANLYIEIFDRDNKHNENLAKLQIIQGDYFSGEIYRHNIYRYKKILHPKFNIEYNIPDDNIFKFSKPNIKWIHPYEKNKREYLNWWNSHNARQLKALEDKEVDALRKVERPKFNQALDMIRARIKEFTNDKNVIDPALIMNKLVDDNNNSLVGIDLARNLARILNKERTVS